MSGIRELFALLYWFNNDKRAILENSLKSGRPASKINAAQGSKADQPANMKKKNLKNPK